MSAINSHTVNKTNANTLTEFLKQHAMFQYSEPKPKVTNTRMPDESLNIKGGSYHIPDDEYPTFLKLYWDEILSKNKNDFLTETQLEKGVIAMDLDFNYHLDITERQHTKEHIEDLLDLCLEELKKIYQFDENTNFNIFVMQKPSVNVVQSENRTKDGVHILICIQSDKIIRLMLRDKLLEQIPEMWQDIPIKNTWKDVFDEGITKGSGKWQLYGSRKSMKYDIYKITEIYEIKYDVTDNELCRFEIKSSNFSIENNLERLSVRYANHPQFFLKNDFIEKYNEYSRVHGYSGSTNDSGSTASIDTNPIARTISPNNLFDSINMMSTLLKVKTKKELDFYLNAFLDSLHLLDYELREAYDYTMALPSTYYNSGSYNKWIQVCFALKNTSERLLIVWLAFSAQSKNFKYSTGIQECCEFWKNAEVRKFDDQIKKRRLSMGSLIRWVKMESYESYQRIKANSIDYHIEKTLNSVIITDKKNCGSCGDTDIANILQVVYGDQFVCAGLKTKDWYRLDEHRWVKNENGTSLRKNISTHIKELFNKKSLTVLNGMAFTNIQNNSAPNQSILDTASSSDAGDQDKNDEIRKLRSKKILGIMSKLTKTNDKNNIMTECAELFYDPDFKKSLDENPYLLCFKNGVIDFEEKIDSNGNVIPRTLKDIFRRGTADDYISMCTNINYIPIDRTRDAKIIGEIEDFMHKLYPNNELYEYMWDHLASVLIGTNPNQTFNLYMGEGSNGKSKLIDLMSLVLGEYKCDVPATLITGDRTKIGGTSPEIIQMKGKRYAVIQEMTKGDRINDGQLKQLTGGDYIQARGLYMIDTISFKPQFKLIVCTNTLPEIKSNDHGIWRRQCVVPHQALFTENPVQNDPEKPYQFLMDKDIDKKFDSWKEVFAALLVERAFKTKGIVKICNAVMAATNEYRADQDYMAQFVRDKIVKNPNGKIRKTELNQEFTSWYLSTYGRGGPSPRELHKYMDKLFGRPKDSKGQCWVGVEINYERNDLDIPDILDDDIDVNDI